MNKKFYQQGDVLIFEEPDGLPKGAKRVKNGRKIILARGEATGHAHAILNPRGVEPFEAAGILFLRLTAGPITIRHEEHGPVTLPAPPKGLKTVYRIGRVQVFDHFRERARAVADLRRSLRSAAFAPVGGGEDRWLH